MFPLASAFDLSHGTLLASALVLGAAFGFVLERAGFASGCRLTGVFYGYDMAVVKVMFTAIVTAMTGLWLLSALGVLAMDELYVVPTHYAAQILGGVLFGAGFVIGGYCPGTSIVAAITGRMDAVAFVAGLLAGTFAFALAFPSLRGFFYVGQMGTQTIPGYFGLPYGLVVFAVVLMALGGFAGAGWLEARMRAAKEDGR